MIDPKDIAVDTVKDLFNILKTAAKVHKAVALAGPMIGERFRAVGNQVQRQDPYMDGTWKWETVYTAKTPAGAEEIARQRNRK